LRGFYRFQIIFKSQKAIDPNGKKLHSFIKTNFHSFNQKYSNSQSRINIHFDPLSLI
jgi:primosomal protein N'